MLSKGCVGAEITIKGGLTMKQKGRLQTNIVLGMPTSGLKRLKLPELERYIQKYIKPIKRFIVVYVTSKENTMKNFFVRSKKSRAVLCVLQGLVLTC